MEVCYDFVFKNQILFNMNDLDGFLSSILVTLITLLPIVNPLSTAVLLLGISEHLSKKDLNRQIVLACIYMVAILVVFYWLVIS